MVPCICLSAAMNTPCSYGRKLSQYAVQLLVSVYYGGINRRQPHCKAMPSYQGLRTPRPEGTIDEARPW
jgi:hypothetical protein